MDRTLQLVSKTSNEIFMLRFPRSVLNFCDYDLAYFAENAIAAGNDALKNGEADSDRITDLRNSIKDAHVYIEHHLRTTYDRIVLDCWIDYVCRRDNVGTASLWNRFAGCKSAFEREVFTRLCDFRYNRAINEWLNLVRVQDYARNKISFVFSKPLTSADEAAARRNYFDLMFSVTAQELGCHTDELGVTKVFTLGRLPTAPFMFPTISKDIIKNLLADLDYSEDYSDGDYSGELSDQIAMDAFAHMKHGLAQEFDSYNISRSQMENASPRVYMPCGLKAAVDLEIDALIESGGWLARCKRCGRYFLRDSEHMQEYCSLKNPGGKTCLEIYELEHPASLLTPELERGCREVTDIMYARIDKDMSLSEYESWKVYLDALADKVKNGEIPPDELREFLRYSRSVDLSRSKPVTEVPKKEFAPKERVVKPFVPERIQRSDISAPKKQEDDDTVERAARREGFFTSPSVQRQKNERSPISHIIRAGEKPAEPSGEGFVGFAESEARRRSESAPKREEAIPAPERSAESEPVRTRAPERFAENPFAGSAPERYMESSFAPKPAPERSAESEPARTRAPERFAEYPFAGSAPERYMESSFAPKPAPERPAESEPARTRAPEQFAEKTSAEAGAAASVPPAEQPAPRPRVIKKNAAAISAYGKMTSAPAAPQLEQVSRPEPTAPPAAREESAPDPDPFKDIGSIFDVLEQSDSDMSDLIPYDEPAAPKQGARQSAPKLSAPKPAEKRAEKRAEKPAAHEPSPEWEEANGAQGVSAGNAGEPTAPPSGFWTEERHLFPESGEEGSELDMLKEKKRGRSSKTRHLYEALMKEPEDNPTFRKKR